MTTSSSAASSSQSYLGDENEPIKISLHDDDIIKGEDGLIFNPFNPLNVEITLNDVQYILTKYGIPPLVHNMNLYKRAFVHRSYTKRPDYENAKQQITIVPQPDNCMPLSTKSNERLEFLGDGLLELVTKYYLYRRFPGENEGFMTEKKIAIVKNEAIGKIALEMKLNKWFVLSKHAEEKKIRTNFKKLGCLFEAFLGALFLDYNKLEIKDEHGWFQSTFVTGPGFQMVQIFIENIFEKHIDWIKLIQDNDNYKNILQVKIQKEFKVTPHYLQMKCDDPEQGFRMGVFLCIGQPIHSMNESQAVNIDCLKTFESVQEYIQNNHNKVFLFLGEGQHKIKRKAEQIACEEALKKIKMYEEGTSHLIFEEKEKEKEKDNDISISSSHEIVSEPISVTEPLIEPITMTEPITEPIQKPVTKKRKIKITT